MTWPLDCLAMPSQLEPVAQTLGCLPDCPAAVFAFRQTDMPSHQESATLQCAQHQYIASGCCNALYIKYCIGCAGWGGRRRRKPLQQAGGHEQLHEERDRGPEARAGSSAANTSGARSVSIGARSDLFVAMPVVPRQMRAVSRFRCIEAQQRTGIRATVPTDMLFQAESAYDWSPHSQVRLQQHLHHVRRCASARAMIGTILITAIKMHMRTECPMLVH